MSKSKSNLPSVRVTILGSGTSTGVPTISCPCAVCASTDLRNKRTRSSIMLTRHDDGRHLVVDTTPDFRQQMLRSRVMALEHVMYTHTHADHTHGFDDLRAFYFFNKTPVHAWISQEHVAELRRRFAYAFEDTGYVGTKPQVLLNTFATNPFEVCGLPVDPLRLPHGNAFTYGFRWGRFAYATDFKGFTPEALALWRGKVTTMVASGLRFRDHPTHNTVKETIQLFADLGVERGIITHLSHDIDHQRDEANLPPNVRFAYDGMELDVAL